MPRRYWVIVDTHNERGERTRVRVAASDDFSEMQMFLRACIMPNAEIIWEDDPDVVLQERRNQRVRYGSDPEMGGYGK